MAFSLSTSEDEKRIKDFLKINEDNLKELFGLDIVLIKANAVNIAKEESFEKAVDYLNESIKQREEFVEYKIFSKEEQKENENKAKNFLKENEKDLRKKLGVDFRSIKKDIIKIAKTEGFERSIEVLNESLDKKDNENKAKNYFRENEKKIQNIGARSKTRSRMLEIAREEGFEKSLEYFNNSIENEDKFKEKTKDYSIEVKYADQLYKAYVNDGISRLDKVNGRFLAAQNLKLDTIIEQNEIIIDLLKKLVEK